MYHRLARSIVYFGIVIGLLSALGNFLTTFEVYAHLQPWVVFLLTVFVMISLAGRLWISRTILLIILSYHIYATFPYISFSAAHLSLITDSPSFRVVQFNINAANSHWQNIRDRVITTHPDILVVCEANNNALLYLRELSDEYPYRIEVGRWLDTALYDVSGTILWSKYPFIVDKPIILKEGRIQGCYAMVDIDGHPTAIYATHLHSPVSDRQISFRDNGLKEITERIQNDSTKNTFLIGDMNQTLWSSVMRKLKKETGFQTVYKGHMFLSSWPSQTYPIGIGIDHIFYRGDMECTKVISGASAGSDHRMLIADFRFKNFK